MQTIKTNNYEVLSIAEALNRREELLEAERDRRAILEIKDNNGYNVSWNMADEIVVLWQ